MRLINLCVPHHILAVLRCISHYSPIDQFLFLSISISYTMERRTLLQAQFLSLCLILWGILLQGGYSHALDDLSYVVDMKLIRWCGILQVFSLFAQHDFFLFMFINESYSKFDVVNSKF